MSRTDVHRPHRVQMADPYERHRFHLFQIWPGRQELWPNSAFTCGCWACTDQAGRKRARRRERVALRAQLRDACKTAPADRDTIDVPAPRHTAS